MLSSGKQDGRNVEHDGAQETVLRISVCTSWDELAEKRAEWEQTLQASASATIFSTYEWQAAWWRAFGHGKQLVAILLSTAQGELVGLAPFYLEALPGRVKRLRLVGDGSEDSDNLDLIFRAGYEAACAQALLDWLGANSIWGFCELNSLPAASPNIRLLLHGLKQRGWTYVTYERTHYVLHLPDTWEAYLGRRPKGETHNFKYYPRRLQRRYAVRLLRCADERELPACLDSLFALHQMRWTAAGEPGSFASAERRRFYEEMSRAFLQRGWLEFWSLELDGKPAAMKYMFRYGDVVYGLSQGRDPAYEVDRVGFVLMIHVVTQFIAEGVRHYDFLSGAESYKQMWGGEQQPYLDIRFTARPLSAARAYIVHSQAQAAFQRGLAWSRAHFPGAYAFLRNAYHQLRRWRQAVGAPEGADRAGAHETERLICIMCVFAGFYPGVANLLCS